MFKKIYLDKDITSGNVKNRSVNQQGVPEFASRLIERYTSKGKEKLQIYIDGRELEAEIDGLESDLAAVKHNREIKPKTY